MTDFYVTLPSAPACPSTGTPIRVPEPRPWWQSWVDAGWDMIPLGPAAIVERETMPDGTVETRIMYAWPTVTRG